LFKEFSDETNTAVNHLHKSLEKVLKERKEVSVTGNDNIFTALRNTREDRSQLVFGKRGRGIYTDNGLKQVAKRIKKRTTDIEEAIKARAANEQLVSGILAVISVFCLLTVWFKLKKSLSGKLILGQMGMGTAAETHE
jgi:hypothetical protein